MIEYDPQPPFDAGALGKASDATRAAGAGVLRPAELISLISLRSGSLARLPTQATLLPRIDRGRYDHRR